jgi:hypothetical protein
LDDGAGDGIRTRDIDLGKVALYQLSYSRALWKTARAKPCPIGKTPFSVTNIPAVKWCYL